MVVADAWRHFADVCLGGVGLDPAYVAGILEVGDTEGESAAHKAQVHKRFGVIYQTVQEWIAGGRMLPHRARDFLPGKARKPVTTLDEAPATQAPEIRRDPPETGRARVPARLRGHLDRRGDHARGRRSWLDIALGTARRRDRVSQGPSQGRRPERRAGRRPAGTPGTWRTGIMLAGGWLTVGGPAGPAGRAVRRAHPHLGRGVAERLAVAAPP